MKSSLASTLILALTLTMTTNPAHAAATPPPANDPNLWLEDVTGEKALGWVRAQNDRATATVTDSAEFRVLRDRFQAMLDSKDRIAGVSKIGAFYYNFWRDEHHVRGIWRRTTLAEYRKSEPAWETVLDLDALGANEKENWVWEGASVLEPQNERALVSLSRGGADASVVREFDLNTKQFVVDGFTLPESKSRASWKDRDHVYVAVAVDSATMTTSGYPRVVREWTRGTPLESAKTIYEGERSDVSVGAYRDHTPGFERDFYYRGVTFYTNEMFVVRDGRPVKLEKPDDASLSVWREWILVNPRTAWTVGGRTYPAGSLIVTKFDDFVAGKRDFEVLFTPTPRTSLATFTNTKNTLLLDVLDNVRSRIFVAKPGAKQWTITPMSGLPEFGSIGISAVDELEGDDYWLTVTDFLTPTSLYLGTVGSETREKLKQTPAFFDASRAVVTQHEAVSKDGTRIPYFEVAPKRMKLDGRNPTLLNGYGGFEVSETPYYSGVRGAGWIERGGVFVLANIRGGGEFGPEWHQSAIKDKRMRCYEDFSAVAKDLIARKVTSPEHLGCIGGSNGGLLVGNMITLYPDLFGAVVCQQPLLDMQRYSHLLAGASWMGEYGDPDKPEEWAFIQKFSPYHNLKAGTKYPPVLFTSSTRDDRVHPGHARKMAARMEEMGANVLYYENIEGGHAGAADNKQAAFMSALAFTFLWKTLASHGM